MPTNKPRINVTVPPYINTALETIAKRDGVPTATKALEFLQIGLEIEEDQVWETLVKKRDTASAKYLSHEQAWS